jgi:formylglycine-generating enzyme required for sulfatase activity
MLRQPVLAGGRALRRLVDLRRGDLVKLVPGPRRVGHGASARIVPLLSAVLIVAACHTITSVTPNPAVSGDSITIVGSNLGATQGASQVLYDGTPITVVAWSATSIESALPSWKASGIYTLSVIVNGETRSVPHTIANPAGMAFVSGGPFLMGSWSWYDEQPPHTVTLDPYWIDANEVTALDYASCVSDGGCTPAAQTLSSCNSGVLGRDDHPINCVDWNQATRYCAWAGKRLPTEAEWEKAARGDDGRTYPWGETTPSCAHAIYRDGSSSGPCSGISTAPVASTPLGSSPYGVHDMAGTVTEWVNDWYDPYYYSVSPPTNPPGPASSGYKVFRGGSWADTAPTTALRTARRAGASTGYWASFVGFRCGRDG